MFLEIGVQLISIVLLMLRCSSRWWRSIDAAAADLFRLLLLLVIVAGVELTGICSLIVVVLMLAHQKLLIRCCH